MSQIPRKDIAVAFLNLAASGNVRDAYDNYVSPTFRHHNPFFLGDAVSLMMAMQDNAAKNPDKILEIQRVLQDGDWVVVHSWARQKPDEPGTAVVHIFRFQDQLITELWDIGQAVPVHSLNQYGMF